MSAQLPAIPNPKYYSLPVPAGADAIKSRRATDVPFGRFMNGFRYQQVYSSSLFTNLPQGGGFIYFVYFRPGCGGLSTTAWTNTVVRMTTTSRGPGELSTTFDENLGLDGLTVVNQNSGSFNGKLDPGSCVSLPGAVGLMWYHFFAPTPFFYDPSKGNLLLELRGGPRKPSEEYPELDPYVYAEATEEGFGATSSVAGEGMNAAQASVVNPFGLVTLFEAAPFPHIDVTLTSTEIVVSWPSYPGPNRLQYRDSLDATTSWTDYTEQPMVGGFFGNLVEIPRASFKSRRYFRVFWDSPQVSVPETPLEVSADPLLPSPTP